MYVYMLGTCYYTGTWYGYDLGYKLRDTNLRYLLL